MGNRRTAVIHGLTKGESHFGNYTGYINESAVFVSHEEEPELRHAPSEREARNGIRMVFRVSAFNVYFKDADNEISFKQHQGRASSI